MYNKFKGTIQARFQKQLAGLRVHRPTSAPVLRVPFA